MELVLRRKFKGPKYTIGDLSINGRFFCNVIEDVVRPAGVKIYGETAIPYGEYKVVMRYSPKFKKVLPLLLDVPMFEGVRIHAGNYAGKNVYLKTVDIPKGFNVIKTDEYFKVV